MRLTTKAATAARNTVIAALCALVAGCCSPRRLPPGSVLLSEDVLEQLAHACQISSLNTEQELLVFGITDYLRSLHVQPGESAQNCRLRRDDTCRIVEVLCAAEQSTPQAPAHCKDVLAKPPETETTYQMPCGCSSKRPSRYASIDFDGYVLSELDRIVIDTHSADRAQALARVVAFAEDYWQKQPPRTPKLRKPGERCARSLHYERMRKR